MKRLLFGLLLLMMLSGCAVTTSWAPYPYEYYYNTPYYGYRYYGHQYYGYPYYNWYYRWR